MKSAYIDKIVLAEEQAEEIVSLAQSKSQEIVSKRAEQLSKDREEFLDLEKKRYVAELNKLEQKYAQKLQKTVADKRFELEQLELESSDKIGYVVSRVVQGVQDGYC
jgi:vacuolar-type H+-ATPase subunit H